MTTLAHTGTSAEADISHNETKLIFNSSNCISTMAYLFIYDIYRMPFWQCMQGSLQFKVMLYNPPDALYTKGKGNGEEKGK